jgi:hypothetical protein
MVTVLADVDLAVRALFRARISTLRDAAGVVAEDQIGIQPPDDLWIPDVNAFNPPKGLNVYLADVREKRKLRTSERIDRPQANGDVRVRTIVGVSTSVTAFLGYMKRGPINRATQVLNFGDFDRAFRGLAANSAVSYAVQQFFQNGGNEAWIVCAETGARAASVTMANKVVVASGVDVLVATATSEGLWGNGIRIEVDHDTVNPLDRFNLTVTEFRDQGGVVTVATREVHRNLSMDSNSAFYAVDVVNAGSTLRLTRPAGALAAAVNSGTSVTTVRLSTMNNAIFGGSSRVRLFVDGSDPRRTRPRPPRRAAGTDGTFTEAVKR